MTAPILNILEQKYALSVKGKKKKRVIKNVLGLPMHLSVGVHTTESNEIQKLNQILNRLLPTAKIPFQQNRKLKKNPQKFENVINKSDLKLAKLKRSQLSIGVNEVNKSLKKKILSAVLLAEDIQPKFLVHHLNLLCTHNKTPFLALPKFRDLTKTTLGFPCIILGFKNNFNDFLEVVNEIKKIYGCQTEKSKEENEEVVKKSIVADVEEAIVEDVEEVEPSLKNKTVTEINYLYKSSNAERTFIPENDKRKPNKSEIEFLSLFKESNNEKEKGDESNCKRKNKMLNFEKSDRDIEVSVVPEKKVKKNQVNDIEKKKKNFRYFSTNLIRTHSNPDRIKKKNK